LSSELRRLVHFGQRRLFDFSLHAIDFVVHDEHVLRVQSCYSL
jgi:hypothetical protein